MADIALQAMIGAGRSSRTSLQQSWVFGPASGAAALANHALRSSTTAAASQQATAVATVVEERIEEKELHMEASESYLAVRDRHKPLLLHHNRSKPSITSGVDLLWPTAADTSHELCVSVGAGSCPCSCPSCYPAVHFVVTQGIIGLPTV